MFMFLHVHVSASIINPTRIFVCAATKAKKLTVTNQFEPTVPCSNLDTHNIFFRKELFFSQTGAIVVLNFLFYCIFCIVYNIEI